MNYDGVHSKIWFNSKECSIPTSNLDEFTKTLSAADTAVLGAPIGVLSVDTPWGEWGEFTYSAEGLAKLKAYRYGYINVDEAMMAELERMSLVYSQRTSGRSVTEDTLILSAARREIAEERVGEFLKTMKELGYTVEETVKMLSGKGD